MRKLMLKSTYRYSLVQNLIAMGWVYAFSIGVPFVFTLLAMLHGSFAVTFETASISANGSVEIATSIAVFIQMIVSFRATMRFSVQNGRSRLTVFVGELLNLFSVAAIYAVGNMLVELIFYAPFHDVSLYSMVYGTPGVMGTFLSIVAHFLYSFAVLSSLGAFGMFLSAMYWRLDSIWKAVVSIGVPVLLVFGIPSMMVRSAAGLRIGSSFARFIAWCMGLPVWDGVSLSPWRPVVFFLVLALIWLVLVYPMLRRTIIKK